MTNPTCPHCGAPIAEHPDTRCLDAMIAEYCFGWRDCRPRESTQWWGYPPTIPGLWPVPNYSRPELIWEVLGWLLERHRVGMWDQGIEISSAGADGWVEWAEFTAPTPELAVKRTAVAVGMGCAE